MADRSHLTPVRVSDRNGWLRTVYRRFVGRQDSSATGKVPAPQVVAPASQGRLPAVRRRPKAQLHEFADKLGVPGAKFAHQLLSRPGGREAGSLALDLLDAGVIHEKALLSMLYDAANVRSPGFLHDTLRVAQRLGGTPDEVSVLGALQCAVVGFRGDQFEPAAKITTEHELDVAAAVVGFVLRLCDERAHRGTITLTEGGGPLRGVRVAFGGLDHLLRDRPQEADVIADYAIDHGPIMDEGDMLPLLAWLDEGIDQNLGDGWL